MRTPGASLLERDDALAQAHAALARAQQGAGSTLLVRGEAGIGKTTLLREWAQGAARDDGAQDSDNILGDVMEALIGACFVTQGFDAAREIVRRLWSEAVTGKAGDYGL